jgi:predicted N-formylglutamate amidohydrolase
MSEAWIDIAEEGGIPVLIVADHASDHVPPDIDLGVAPDVLSLHIALDIGVAPLARALCRRLRCQAVLGGVSRLVVDLNREEDAPHVVPIASDGHAIPGNAIDHAARQKRIRRFWQPYHRHVAETIVARRPALLLSLHSFTPLLETEPEQTRPWQVGVLYNEDDRAARIAIPLLEAQGLCVGDQQPYSGKLLNASMNRHGEANGIPYLGLEIRQDQIADEDGVQRWAALLCPVIESCSTALSSGARIGHAHA